MFNEVKNFLNTTLKLEISEEKSGIHHAKEGTAFLGYVVKNFTTDKVLKFTERHEGGSNTKNSKRTTNSVYLTSK